MVLSEGHASDKVLDRHGLTDIGGPLFVGGVSFLTPATGLFTDSRMLRHLRTEQSFRDYLEFREEAFKLAVEEMVAACDSPFDLFMQTERDEKIFKDHFFEFVALRDQYSVIVDDGSKVSGADKLSPHHVLNKDELNHIRHKNLKNVALLEINSSLSSELEKHLRIPDQWLMQEYFNRVKIRNLARECSNQAEKTGVILVEEFLPIRFLEEQMLPKRLPLNLKEQMKQRVKQSLKSATGYLHRQGGATRTGALKVLAFGAISALSCNMLDESS